MAMHTLMESIDRGEPDMFYHQKFLFDLRRPEGSEVDFHFFVVSYRRECQLPETFFRMENVVPSQSYRIFKSQKYIQLHCAQELKSRFPENQLKKLSSPTFFEINA